MLPLEPTTAQVFNGSKSGKSGAGFFRRDEPRTKNVRHAHFSIRFFAVFFFVLRMKRVVVDTHGTFNHFFFLEDIRIYSSFETVFGTIRSGI